MYRQPLKLRYVLNHDFQDFGITKIDNNPGNPLILFIISSRFSMTISPGYVTVYIILTHLTHPT
ncbi:MAG: hypothetical protein BWK80_05390 [Desulfobacteraceae bacterium IS3]|nr:MAG: hypothetical protein BWK80_05390 [Desulfobacteraceae bacterium IS3]HAO21278.1 hypothetical protein [Desulfobacteraceae bacterium]